MLIQEQGQSVQFDLYLFALNRIGGWENAITVCIFVCMVAVLYLNSHSCVLLIIAVLY